MTVTASIPLADQQHLVLDHVSWNFYERVLSEMGDRPIRVAFWRGSIEIMPPLPEHEFAKKAIGSLIELAALELELPMAAFGSTTFRREDRQAGLDPDECYYLENEAKVRGMTRFDPAVHPAPDLALEIEITQRSIPRLPIYAELGVPEVWRFDGRHLTIVLLTEAGEYQPARASKAFPMLPIEQLERFILRLECEDRLTVLRDFRNWLRTLASE